jgi:hypothetical protein
MSLREQLKKAKESKGGFKFPDGTYIAKFKDFKIGKSRKGEEMISLKFKVKDIIDGVDEGEVESILDKIEENEKYIEMKLVTKIDFQWLKAVQFANDCGINIDEIEDEDMTTMVKNLKKALTRIEDNPPTCEIFGKRNENDAKYMNWYFNDIENMFGENIVDIDGAEYKWNDLIEAGWTADKIKEAVKGGSDE